MEESADVTGTVADVNKVGWRFQFPVFDCLLLDCFSGFVYLFCLFLPWF